MNCIYSKILRGFVISSWHAICFLYRAWSWWQLTQILIQSQPVFPAKLPTTSDTTHRGFRDGSNNLPLLLQWQLDGLGHWYCITIKFVVPGAPPSFKLGIVTKDADVNDVYGNYTTYFTSWHYVSSLNIAIVLSFWGFWPESLTLSPSFYHIFSLFLSFSLYHPHHQLLLSPCCSLSPPPVTLLLPRQMVSEEISLVQQPHKEKQRRTTRGSTRGPEKEGRTESTSVKCRGPICNI